MARYSVLRSISSDGVDSDIFSQLFTSSASMQRGRRVHIFTLARRISFVDETRIDTSTRVIPSFFPTLDKMRQWHAEPALSFPSSPPIGPSAIPSFRTDQSDREFWSATLSRFLFLSSAHNSFSFSLSLLSLSLSFFVVIKALSLSRFIFADFISLSQFREKERKETTVVQLPEKMGPERNSMLEQVAINFNRFWKMIHLRNWN